MKFVLDFDHGDEINFWISPDNPLSIPQAIVSSDGRRLLDFPANIVDGGLKSHGLHSTGQCRFVLAEPMLPGLAGMTRLEIRDADTNVLIYRRMPSDTIANRRIVLINTSVRGEAALEATLFPHFQYTCFGMQNLSDEILDSIFRSNLPSQFLSGNILVPRYNMFFMQEMMLSTILLQDPHVEMAARLFWLKERAAAALDPAHGWRLGPMREAAAFAQDYDYADGKSLKRFLRMMPEGAYKLLYNPLTRQLATRSADDRLNPALSMIAVELLAQFDIVGHRNFFEAFALSLFDRLGIAGTVPVPEPIPAAVLDLAERLRRLKEVEEMLVYDRALSDAVLASVDRNWQG